MERGLDPLTTNLVVADISRTEKTICLVVTPSLKAHGISGRARLFEVVQRVKTAPVLGRYVRCSVASGKDYLIANEDRHQDNFGLIRDANTLEWLGAAPIFDRIINLLAKPAGMWYDNQAGGDGPGG